MKKWLDPQPINVPDDLQARIAGHPIVAQSLIRRGIQDVAAAQQFLNPAAYTPTAASTLPDMDKAVARVRAAINNGQHILIWGDFDVDGQTSTALLVSALHHLGAHVRYHVPNRFTEGHGIDVNKLSQLLNTGVDLILTCDTGITAHEAVDYANLNGVDVVITDHHSLPPTLPHAHAVVNPMRLPPGHPLRELPGVGTAYKFVQALYDQQPTDHLLDLVAMGIVADVMVQIDDTRYLLQRGLQRLRENPRPGLAAMMERAGITPADLTEMDIGFSLAPRLNAIGRLADANPAVELLTTDDPAIIAERVNELEGLNQTRRLHTRQVYAAAKERIASDPSLLKYAALVVVGEGWHAGVVGIVASKLVEDYALPTLVLSKVGDKISGSARSVVGVNLVKAISTQAHLLDGYGGHTMAAGLRMPAENIHEFQRGLSQAVREMRGDAPPQPQLQLDAYVRFDEIDLAFAEDIARLAPFGNGNPPLTLATQNVRVKSRRTLGSRGDHLELRLVDDAENEQRVVWWFGDIADVPQGSFDIAYTVRANTFKGQRQALVEWLDARIIESDIPQITPERPYDVQDYRQQPHKFAQIRAQYPAALVFAEGDKSIDGADRFSLYKNDALIVWTAPPDQHIWKAILDNTAPQQLILFGQIPPFVGSKPFIKQLYGMAIYALKHKNARISLNEIAALTGQSAIAVEAALHYLNATTALHFENKMDDGFSITQRQHTPPLDANKQRQLQRRLELALEEVHAFRQSWLKRRYD